MDLTYFLSAGMFVHLALLFYILALLAREELLLRGLLMIGTVFYIIYYTTSQIARFGMPFGQVLRLALRTCS